MTQSPAYRPSLLRRPAPAIRRMWRNSRRLIGGGGRRAVSPLFAAPHRHAAASKGERRRRKYPPGGCELQVCRRLQLWPRTPSSKVPFGNGTWTNSGPPDRSSRRSAASVPRYSFRLYRPSGLASSKRCDPVPIVSSVSGRHPTRAISWNTQPSSTVGSHHRGLSTLAIAVVFLGLMPSLVLAYVGISGLIAASFLNVWLRVRQLRSR